MRLRWAGHVERSEEGSLFQRIWRGKPGGRRCLGRPRRNWMENVEEDTRELVVRGWWRRTQEGRECAKIVKQGFNVKE
ncbi:hypothetical protein C0J52_27096 [Blattella germanica]|nr:hypothetical protein C0J52_27096 [Blattella germanica]